MIDEMLKWIAQTIEYKELIKIVKEMMKGRQGLKLNGYRIDSIKKPDLINTIFENDKNVALFVESLNHYSKNEKKFQAFKSLDFKEKNIPDDIDKVELLIYLVSCGDQGNQDVIEDLFENVSKININSGGKEVHKHLVNCEKTSHEENCKDSEEIDKNKVKILQEKIEILKKEAESWRIRFKDLEIKWKDDKKNWEKERNRIVNDYSILKKEIDIKQSETELLKNDIEKKDRIIEEFRNSNSDIHSTNSIAENNKNIEISKEPNKVAILGNLLDTDKTCISCYNLHIDYLDINTSINSLMRIINSGRIIEALEKIINSKRLERDYKDAVDEAKRILDKLNNN